MAENEGGRIEPPLEMDLGENPGPVVFTTFQDIIEWADVESKAWAALAVSAGIPGPVNRQVTIQRNTATDLTNRATQRDLDHVREILHRYKRYECLHSASAWGRRVLKIAESNTLEAVALLWAKAEWEKEVATGKGSNWLSNPQFHSQSSLYVGATARVAAISASDYLATQQARTEEIQRRLVAAESTWREMIASARERENAALAAFDNALQQHRAEIADQLASKSDEVADFVRTRKDEIFDFIRQRTNEIAALEQIFREKISLEAPVNYWRRKETVLSRAVKLWGGVATLVTLGPLGALTIYRSEAYSWFKDVQPTLSTGGVAILLVVAVLYLTFGRFVSKLFSSSLSLRDDASERVVMAETFLALHRDGKLNDEDRRLVLAPLFRPHGAATESESAAGLADAISKAMTPGR